MKAATTSLFIVRGALTVSCGVQAAVQRWETLAGRSAMVRTSLLLLLKRVALQIKWVTAILGVRLNYKGYIISF